MTRIGLLFGGATAGIIAFAVLTLTGGGPAFAEFVCPVTPISDAAVNHAEDGVFSLISEGDYSNLTTILKNTEAGDPANNRVTEGSPMDSHANPGEDSTYTAIWDDGEPSGATKNPKD